MSDALNPIVGVSIPANTVTLLYTVPALTKTTLLNLIVMNQGGSVGTYQIWHAVSGDTAPTVATDLMAGKYVNDQPIAGKERQVIDQREVLLAGSKLYFFCTQSCTVRGSVLEQA